MGKLASYLQEMARIRCAGPGSPDTWLVNAAIMPWRPDGARGGPVVGCGSHGVRAASARCSRRRTGGCGRAAARSVVEALDPQRLLLEGLDELLDDAVGLGLVVKGWRAVDAEVGDLGLVVGRAEAAAAVVAQLQAGRGAGLDRAEAVADRLAQQVGGGEAVHPRRGVDPRLAGAVIDDREHRAAAVLARPRLGRVGRPQLVRDVGRDAAGVQAPEQLSNVVDRGLTEI